MATSVYSLMKDLHSKWKKGFKVSDTEDFLSLIVLCSSENSSERLSACKCVQYMLEWKIIEVRATLNLLTALAARSKEVDGALALSFNIASELCHNEDHFFLKNDHKTFLQCISSVISFNDNSVPVILSLFDKMDINFVMHYYRNIVHDMVFGEHPHRSLAWSKLSSRIDINMHRNFLLWLKFTRIEDCLLLLMSLEKAPLSKTEKCLHYTAIMYHMMVSGLNPTEVVNMLLDNILTTSIQTQSLVLLTILLGIDSYSDLYLYVVLDFCEWFVTHTKIWNEIVWIIITSLVTLPEKSVFRTSNQQRAEGLINKLMKTGPFEAYDGLKFTEMSSVILKHVIYRHDSLHQSLLVAKLLSKFRNEDRSLSEWLNKLLKSSQPPAFRGPQIIVEAFFLSKSPEIQRLCVAVLEKWKIESTNLYIFQLAREQDPLMTLDILRILSTKSSPLGNEIVNDFLNILSKGEHENSFNLKVDLLRKSCLHGYKLDDSLPVILNEKTRPADILEQALLVQTISKDLNIHFEVIIPFCNNIINMARNSNGTIATSLVIDSVCVMCEKGILDISMLWDNLMAIVAGDEHPAVHRSVCNLLAKVPLLIKSDKDCNGILYKSARVLWHFVNTSANREFAIRCLWEYDLDIFDITFLSDECKTHLRYSPEVTVLPKIEGNCWMHMINDFSLADLFVHFINKKYSTARYYGSYSSLFEAVANYLTMCPPDAIQQIIICFKLLCANWTHVPEGRKIYGFERFISENSKQEIKELAILASLNHFSNESGREAFNDFMHTKKYSEREKAIICFRPEILLRRERQYNEKVLFEGLAYGLGSDFNDIITGNSLNNRVEEAIISCAKNTSLPTCSRRTVMKILVCLWAKLPYKNEVFRRISKILTTIYGYAFLKSLPCGQFSCAMTQKVIYLCREIVLKTKSLYCYDSAITIGQKNASLQKDVLDNFLDILQNLGDEKRSNNIKWILRILCSAAITGSDFMCEIVVHGTNFLCGTSLFNLSITLKESLDYFPLAMSMLSRASGKGKYIILTLNEIISKTDRVNPVFVETFWLAIMRIRDEPMISYSSVIKRTLA